MKLVSNTVQANQVEEHDDHYLIKDVSFIRPMELSGGYVPEYSIRQTANKWQSKPSTLNHPRNTKGEPIAANRKPETHIGEITKSWWDTDRTRANIKINKADIQSGEAADIHAALENGEQIEVSSQYEGKQLPPGEYDGEHRENVEAIVQPDSVAILPNKKGRCSVQDGCGINPQMAANAAIRVPMTPGTGEDSGIETDMQANQTDMALTDVTPDDIDSYTDSEWDGSAAVAAMPNPSESEDAASALDAAHLVHPTSDDARDSKANWKLPFREGENEPANTRALVAAKAALEGARGGVEGIPQEDREGAQERIDDFLADAPEDMFGSMEAGNSGHMEDNALSSVVNTLAEMAGFTETTSDEHETEESESTMDRDKLIDEVTANSALTEESLEERCDDGLEAIHSDVMEANTNDNTNEDVAELREKVESLEAELSANEESEKEEIATDIVANSAEYEDTESVLEDYPTEAALNTKKESLETGGTMPGMGATANADLGSEDDLEDISSGVFN